MCGICGVYGNHTERTRRQIHAMMLSIAHRGPDDNGCYSGPGCGLGHQRLAILDLSDRGKQPMSNEGSEVWSVVNGEIYNYKSLRDLLQSRGHTFQSDCDSEVVVHAYEDYGDRFVEELRGMFAIAIHDGRTNKLILARDPSGKKPLYYSWHNRTLLFASEVKGLLAGGVPCRVNHDSIPAYLMYQYVPGKETLFRGVQKLQAGHTLTVTEDGGAVDKRYWHISDATRCTENYSVPYLRHLLEESVRLRLQSDVPIGAFLSGGIDSSAVLALWRKQYSGPLHTFTASFGDISEAKQARGTSAYLNTEYHEVWITPQMVADNLDRITYHHDEPLGDAAIINNYFLAREAKKYVTVVLAGEGGDELFGGYPWHRYATHANRLSKLHPHVKRLGATMVKAIHAEDPISRWYPMGRAALLPCQYTLLDTLLYSTTAMSSLTLGWLMPGSPSPIVDAVPTNGITHPYNQALAADYLNLLPEKFLMKADKATMAFGIEERLPLLDQEIVRLAFSIDPRLKRDKYVLRKAVEDLLPPATVWRPKKGFGTPIGAWLQDAALRDRVTDSLFNGELLQDVCRPEALRKLAEYGATKGYAGKASLSPSSVVWGLFALQVWHDVWFS